MTVLSRHYGRPTQSRCFNHAHQRCNGWLQHRRCFRRFWQTDRGSHSSSLSKSQCHRNNRSGWTSRCALRLLPWQTSQSLRLLLWKSSQIGCQSATAKMTRARAQAKAIPNRRPMAMRKRLPPILRWMTCCPQCPRLALLPRKRKTRCCSLPHHPSQRQRARQRSRASPWASMCNGRENQ